ncbi:hypothetical protein ABZP36_024024 [Zizania latifolia]
MASRALHLLWCASVCMFLPSARAQATIFTSTIDGKEATTFSFPMFDKSLMLLKDNLTFSSNAAVTQEALHITPDTGNRPEIFLVNKAGRVFFPTPYVVWVSNSSNSTAGGKHIASFSTVFKANLFRSNLNKTVKGEGLAFVIVSRNDGELAPIDTTNDDGSFFVWVDYNGTSRHVWVYMSKNETKPTAAVLNASLDISTVLLGNKAFFGFSASTGLRYQLNIVRMWNMTVERLHDGSAAVKNAAALSGWKLAVAVGVSCGVVAVVGLFAALHIRKRRRRIRDNPYSTIDFRSIPGVAREFDYMELRKGTNNFDKAMKLGQGGYGVVYRATVVGEDGRSVDVAVKQFSGAKTDKGKEDFLAELSIINCLRHRNLVKLVGKQISIAILISRGCLEQATLRIFFRTHQSLENVTQEK